jgi:hypothetical protein
MMKVEQLDGAVNQFVITDDDGGLWFQSYSTMIAAKVAGRVYLSLEWDYSRTTGKYRNRFLGCDGEECKRRIKAGVYVVMEELSRDAIDKLQKGV